MLINPKELEILKKYEKGKTIDPADEEILNTYGQIGIIQFGLAERNGVFKGTAKLSSVGKELVNRQLFLSNPVKRFIYNILSLFGPPYRINI